MESTNWVLNCFNNSLRKGQESVIQEKAKGMYIAKERTYLENAFGKENVTEVFGEPSDLEKAEILLLQIKEGTLTQEQRWNHLIQIAYDITNSCGKELDSNNPVWDKYATLYCAIPIQLWQMKSKDVQEISFIDLEKTVKTISADFLQKMKTRIARKQEIPLEPDLEAYYEYLFGVVLISLQEIFQEVKAEIMKP